MGLWDLAKDIGRGVATLMPPTLEFASLETQLHRPGHEFWVLPIQVKRRAFWEASELPFSTISVFVRQGVGEQWFQIPWVTNYQRELTYETTLEAGRYRRALVAEILGDNLRIGGPEGMPVSGECQLEFYVKSGETQQRSPERIIVSFEHGRWKQMSAAQPLEYRWWHSLAVKLARVKPRYPRTLYGRAHRVASRLNRLSDLMLAQEAKARALNRSSFLSGNTREINNFYETAVRAEREFDQKLRADVYLIYDELTAAGIEVEEDPRAIRAQGSQNLNQVAANIRFYAGQWLRLQNERKLKRSLGSSLGDFSS